MMRGLECALLATLAEQIGQVRTHLFHLRLDGGLGVVSQREIVLVGSDGSATVTDRRGSPTLLA